MQVGQKLTIPGKPGAVERSASRPAPSARADDAKPARADAGKAPARAKGGSVTVKAGDTLYSIARANNVSAQDLQKANKLDASAKIRPGQKLLLP